MLGPLLSVAENKFCQTCSSLLLQSYTTVILLLDFYTLPADLPTYLYVTKIIHGMDRKMFQPAYLFLQGDLTHALMTASSLWLQ